MDSSSSDSVVRDVETFDGREGESLTVDADLDAAIDASPELGDGGAASERIYGITIDGVDPIDDIVGSIAKLPRKMTTRVVFDPIAASSYVSPVKKLHAVSFVMGELVDSSDMKTYDLAKYSARTTEYLDALGGDVDVWEIGNEINGDWLGDTPSVVAKMKAAFDLVEKRGEKTALTLYYNAGCGAAAEYEMFTWADKNVPSSMRDGLEYVLVSYYEEDCSGLRPDWPKVFDRLALMFPKSKIGFGECGVKDIAAKPDYLRRYYTMSITTPSYVGGYFWWYYRQDMVPMTKPLWVVLADAIR